MQSLRALPRAAFSVRSFSSTTIRPLAKMQLIGRLADQPESSPTSTGREISRFALGVSSGPRDENGNRGVSWFNIASFVEGPQRDLLLSLPKGTLMHVEADAKMDTYQGQDGANRRTLNLLMRNFEMLSRPQNRDTSSGGPSDAGYAAAAEPASAAGQS